MLPVHFLRRAADFGLTLILWVYFLFGYPLLLLILLFPLSLRLKNVAAVIQMMLHLHMKYFFALVRLLFPKTSFQITENVRSLRSSIIICNHLSYLDPILLVSLFPRHTTIVKKTFFRVPIFGWFLKKAGYIPSAPAEMSGPAMIDHLESIKRHLAAGGNLFVFPEGTRSRHGEINPFNRGVFSIARYCRKGLSLVLIQNTDKLFRPGTFSFATQGKHAIAMELIGALEPDYQAKNFSLSAVVSQSRQIFEREIAARKPGQEKS
jgi:1-acyl-sn-glycerol-3-phosphate acyltransferase